MASPGPGRPGTATVISQTVTALCQLLSNLVPLIESPFPPTSAQLEDAFYALCSTLQDIPVTVMAHTNNVPRTPSPLLHTFHTSFRFPEFGEEGGTPLNSDTPASSTAEHGHSNFAEPSPIIATASDPLIATNMADSGYEEPGWDFTLIDDVADNTPPECPPSPIAPAHLASCDCPPPNGHTAMGIKWWPCSRRPASSNITENH